MDVEEIIKERTPIWLALANFYLDTDLHDTELERIVRIFKASPYSLEKIRAINRFEIKPVLNGDMIIPKDVWVGFNEEWLIKNASQYLNHEQKTSKLSDRLYKFFKSDNWQRMERIYNDSLALQQEVLSQQKPIHIETPRLLLRQMAVEDAIGMFELYADPDVNRFTGDKPFNNIDEALDFIRNYNVYDMYGCGRLSTFIKETGEYIGWCGLKYMPEKKETDIGYRFLKRYRGKGYATESAAACLKDGFERLNLSKIIGTAMKENTASINVFKKLRLKYTFDQECGCQPGVVYSISRQDWEATQQ